MNFMKIKKIHISLILTLFFLSTISVNAQNGSIKKIKLEKFYLQSSAAIEAGGEILSTEVYQPKVYWFPVKVPSTVLTGLVANKVYPDPYIGLNNMLIPDASDQFNQRYDLEKYSHIPNEPNPWKKPYWYRTSFEVPASDKGRHFQLIFKGINYRAAVWLNGHQIADSTEMAGMFAEYFLDVSEYIKAGENNILAVKIYPLDYPGLPDTEQLEALGDFYLNGGPTGDIGKNVTMLCSVGWDWLPPVRDRNMGIWQPVYLKTSGKVTIEKPQIVTKLPGLPDAEEASLDISVTLSNSNASDISGKLEIKIAPENFEGTSIEFSRDINIESRESQKISLNASEIEALRIQQPKLWWPHGYGKQNLYRIDISFAMENAASDHVSIVTGIRTVSTKAIDVEGKALRRDFYVNGKRVHLNGGAWVPDMMLQRDSLRLEQELRHCQNANVNLVRIWGGGITPPDDFFNIADRLGLMIWSDFWITGDTQGEFKGSPDWPLEGSVFISNMTSTIYRIRNHPSLLVWTGGNEGHARKELYDAMRNGIIELDGTRPFIPSSSGFANLPEEWKGSWPDNKASGVYSGGPYTWNPPQDYYDFVDNRRDWVFKDETGLPSQPVHNSLPKIIPNLIWDKELPFPFNNTWGYHDAASGNGRYDRYYEDMLKRYGAPESMEEFSEKMQLMNADGYRGIFEAAGHKLNETGGVMLWKLNAAFPSVIWQVYDWYLQPNAGYYYMQNACEPVHIQLNYNDYQVAVINRTYQPIKKLHADVKVISIDGDILLEKSKKLNIDATDTQKILELEDVVSEMQEIIFVVLKLKDAEGLAISQNTYWLAPGDDFTQLQALNETKLDTEIVKKTADSSEQSWEIKITNNSDQLAFFVRGQFMVDGEELQPSYWSDNYFSLAPGDSRSISVAVPNYLINNEIPKIQISGWNVTKSITFLRQH
jgi:beta-galactosidase/beta-glucuronidase